MIRNLAQSQLKLGVNCHNSLLHSLQKSSIQVNKKNNDVILALSYCKYVYIDITY